MSNGNKTSCRDVYIMGGLRSPIGVYRGQYKTTPPEVLGAAVVDALLERTGYTTVDRVYCGNAVAGGGNIGRLTALLSSLPETVPAVTVDMQCASAGGALEWAYSGIRAGLYDTVLAGGTESSSLQPLRTYGDDDYREGSYRVAQFSPHERDELAMLKGAERTMQKYQVRADELTPWILRSHQRAVLAEKEGYLQSYKLDGEDMERRIALVSKAYSIPQPILTHVPVDECIRPRMSERLLQRMPSLLGPNTLTTAGNACLTHDGAAFLLLGTQPSRYRIAAVTAWAGNPLYSPEGAMEATEQLLTQTGLTMAAIDAVEWNEAFAVIDVLFGRRYEAYTERYNRCGGALAYGHPYGASGAIIVLHLMASLECCGGRYGLAAIAGAGGVGTAMLIERMITK